MLCPGQVYETTLTVGDGTAPAGAVFLTITRPDGTTEPGVVPVGNPAGTGKYKYDYVLPTPGRFVFAWSTTGPGTAPTPIVENVRAYASMLSRNEIKQHLNITWTKDDDELDTFLMAATEMIESKTGQLFVPRQVTTRIDEGTYRLVLDVKPIQRAISVTSVWPGGPVWTEAQLRPDSDAGIVDQAVPRPFYWGPWDVVVLAGMQVMPERALYAGKEQVRHMWETQRGSMPPALLQGEEEYVSPMGFTFTIPRRVLEAIEDLMVPAV
jgi:uncharacterized phiE125 gp8 family phage protein